MLSRKSPAFQGNQELKHPLPHAAPVHSGRATSIGTTCIGATELKQFHWCKICRTDIPWGDFHLSDIVRLDKGPSPAHVSRQTKPFIPSFPPSHNLHRRCSGIFNTAPAHPSSLHAENTTTLQAQPFSPYFLFICTAQVSPSPHTSCFYTLHRFIITICIAQVYMHTAQDRKQ